MASHRAGPVTTVVLACLMAACALPAHAASISRVQRLIHPEDAARLASRGVRVPAATMRPAELEALAARARRSHEVPHVLTRPGLDWSISGSRRPGWSRPMRPAVGAEAAAGRAGALGVAAGEHWDTLRVAILRIDFLNDRGGSASTGDGRFATTPDPTQPPIDRAPRNRTYYQKHGEALERYFDVQTYGRVLVETDVWPRSENGAYSVSDMADFGPWKFSPDIYDAAVHMMRTMLFAADSQSIGLGDRVPWDSYDRIVIIHAGSDLQSDLRQDSNEDIPSFTVGLSDTDVVVFPDSTTRAIDRAAFIPETINQDGYYGAINGVLAHECGHLFFGFFDVYDINSGYPVCGYWTLMDSGNLVGARVGLEDGSEIYATGLLPPSIDPFQRAFTTDVLPLDPLEWDVTDSLRSSQRFPDIRRLDLTGDEYLLIENRWLAPADSVQLDQDSTTRVVMGPKAPDRFEYDALLPGGGVLVWHVDESVIPLESSFPLDTALRVNPDFGLNSNWSRLGLSIVEADGLADLGDGSSPYLLGSFFDPFFVGNNAVLSDTTAPSLIPHIGTRTHMRFDVLDTLRSTMRVRATRGWGLPGWPRAAAFAPGGATLLAVDATGDGRPEIAWAGGTRDGADSADVFVMRSDGTGLLGASPRLASLPRRPDPVMAATAVPAPGAGALFAVVTRPAFPGDTAAGWLHVRRETGAEQPGFPVKVGPTATPPVIAGVYPNAAVFVGCSDGRVHGYALHDGTPFFSGPALPDSVTGRIAARVDVQGTAVPGAGRPPELVFRVASGCGDGTVQVTHTCAGDVLCATVTPSPLEDWTAVARSTTGARPDFLWLPFGGDGAAASSPCGSPYSLVVRDADRLWAFCDDGTPLPGWGRVLPDSLVPGLGAGDPDGDGYPEVLVQTVRSAIAFVNASGAPSTGWPKRPTEEDLRSTSPALAADVDGDGRTEVVAMAGTGVISALGAAARPPAGWPLASGAGVMGSAVVADLDGDGFLELVAPDNINRLWGYAIGAPATGRAAAPWPMLGGDAGRTCVLPLARAPLARAASDGPLAAGTLVAFPNPARQRPVNFAYTLTEPARVEFRVLDTSGHEVATFAREGRQAENLVTWDPGALPAGLYLVQVRIRAGERETRRILQVGVLR